MAQNWNRYGPTAARPPAKKPGREVRPKSVTIDVHAHIAVPEADKLVRPHIDLSRIPFARYSTPETKALNASQDADLVSRMTQYDERLRDLDAMGLDLQLVMCPPAAVLLHGAGRGRRAGHPHRQRRHRRLRRQEARPLPRARQRDDAGRATGREGARALHEAASSSRACEILTNVDGKELSDPAFAPFWKKAEELGAVVLLHPAGFTDAQRLSRNLLQQRDRQSVRYDNGAPLSDFRRRAGASSQPEDHQPCTAAAISPPIPAASITPGARARTCRAICRSRRRAISRRSMSTLSCSRRTSSRRWSRCSASITRARHRLSLRHGRIRSDRALVSSGFDASDRRRRSPG